MLYRRMFVRRHSEPEHHHVADPVLVDGSQLKGLLQIVETPLGEKMRFVSSQVLDATELLVEIARGTDFEILHLERSPDDPKIYLSAETPEEPHEFEATLKFAHSEVFKFQMKEPLGHHHHGHAHLDDEAHAQAHASTLPSYVKTGERPSALQIIGFGAAGGMIPCPASITVMLLALSTGKAAMGVFTVLGFSLGLALALVGVGVIVVTGLSRLSNTGRLSWVTQRAPVVSAALVIASGITALLFAR
jgi:ABC-type nickel/cobalt efflux system permease component RcnA